jgi:hypothetical protein
MLPQNHDTAIHVPKEWLRKRTNERNERKGINIKYAWDFPLHWSFENTLNLKKVTLSMYISPTRLKTWCAYAKTTKPLLITLGFFLNQTCSLLPKAQIRLKKWMDTQTERSFDVTDQSIWRLIFQIMSFWLGHVNNRLSKFLFSHPPVKVSALLHLHW